MTKEPYGYERLYNPTPVEGFVLARHTFNQYSSGALHTGDHEHQTKWEPIYYFKGEEVVFRH